MTKLEELKSLYEHALNEEFEYMGYTLIQNEETHNVLLTKNSYHNHVKYFVENYDKNLVHKSPEANMKITNIIFGNDSQSILKTLGGK